MRAKLSKGVNKLSVVSLLGISCALGLVFNEKNNECGPCVCPEEDNPVCVNEDDKKKKFTTYNNPCEFFCTAFCYESTIKFMYCGKCDDRDLPKYGHKGNISDFACLDFQANGGSPFESIPPRSTIAPPKEPAGQEIPGETGTALVEPGTAPVEHGTAPEETGTAPEETGTAPEEPELDPGTQN